MSRRVATVLLALAAACTPAVEEPATTTTEPTKPPTTPRSTVPLVPGCANEGEFTEGGHVDRINQQLSDATTIGAISWEVSPACEIFTISFQTSEGAPATTPPAVIVDYLDSLPIIRIALDTEATVVTDQLVETALVERLYVVKALDGGMFIDLHLRAPAQSLVSIDTSPATLRLDLQPGIVESPDRPAITDLTVVISPSEGDAVASPLEVTGYSRTFEANVMFIATSGGQVVARANTTAADSGETWGEFVGSLEIGPGPISLFVGDQSAEDGSLQGVTLALAVE